MSKAATWEVGSSVNHLQLPPGVGGIEKEETLNVHYHVPKSHNKRRRRHVVFVIHGVNRNAATYLKNWTEHSENEGFTLICPEFSEALFQDTFQDGGVYDHVKKTFVADPQLWTFSVIERVFTFLQETGGTDADQYDLYGHSAGAQFAHRFVTFMPGGACRLRNAIAANPGWYTAPSMESRYPYGLLGYGGKQFSEKDVVKLQTTCFSRNLTVLLGDADVDTEDKNLRVTAEANAQGPHRFARGRFYYEHATETAKAVGVELQWKTQIVAGVGHNDRKMSHTAATLFTALWKGGGGKMGKAGGDDEE